MSGSSLHIAARIIAGAAFLALALPAQAAEQAELASKVAPSSEGGGSATGEKLICKRYDSTGSRLKAVRACLTKEQWKKLDQERF